MPCNIVCTLVNTDATASTDDGVGMITYVPRIYTEPARLGLIASHVICDATYDVTVVVTLWLWWYRVHQNRRIELNNRRRS